MTETETSLDVAKACRCELLAAPQEVFHRAATTKVQKNRIFDASKPDVEEVCISVYEFLLGAAR